MSKVKTATIAEPLSQAERDAATVAAGKLDGLRKRRDRGLTAPNARDYNKLTEEAFALWLEKIREVFDPRQAAALAFADRPFPSADALLAACRADPLRLRAMHAAQDYARARIGRALIDRGVNGWLEPVWHQGQQCGEVRRFDSKALLACAANFNNVIEKRTSNDLTTHNADAAGDILFALDWNTVAAMPADVRKNYLVPLLEYLRAAKANGGGGVSTTDAAADPLMIEDASDGADLSDEDRAALEEICDVR